MTRFDSMLSKATWLTRLACVFQNLRDSCFEQISFRQFLYWRENRKFCARMHVAKIFSNIFEPWNFFIALWKIEYSIKTGINEEL